MSTRASATRYAKALLDVAISEGSPEAEGRKLTRFAELVRAHPDLQRMVNDPVVSAPTKRAVVEALVERLGPSSPSGKLLVLLAARGRLGLLEDLVEVYDEQLRDHQRVLEAELTTATPLAAEGAVRLQKRLAAMTGRTVVLRTRVDTAILGGIVARIGGIVYDGSIATQLARIRNRLARRD